MSIQVKPNNYYWILRSKDSTNVEIGLPYFNEYGDLYFWDLPGITLIEDELDGLVVVAHIPFPDGFPGGIA